MLMSNSEWKRVSKTSSRQITITAWRSSWEIGRKSLRLKEWKYSSLGRLKCLVWCVRENWLQLNSMRKLFLWLWRKDRTIRNSEFPLRMWVLKTWMLTLPLSKLQQWSLDPCKEATLIMKTMPIDHKLKVLLSSQLCQATWRFQQMEQRSWTLEPSLRTRTSWWVSTKKVLKTVQSRGLRNTTICWSPRSKTLK